MSGRLVAIAALAGLLAGCDTYHYLAGTWREDRRAPALALRHYEAFLESRPRDPRACEVRLRAAELYRTFFDRCAEARAHFEAAARDFPRRKECVERAALGVLRCPDYFPLDAGRSWVHVDSASKGKAMRLDLEQRSEGKVLATRYAGNRKQNESQESYEKADWAVWRVQGKSREALIRYPYTPGRSWKARRGRVEVEWTIVSDSAEVAVAAGRFKGCLKVREHDKSFPKAWRYDYYCPGVGRVKVTVGGPGFENPNTELLRFDKIR